MRRTGARVCLCVFCVRACVPGSSYDPGVECSRVVDEAVRGMHETVSDWMPRASANIDFASQIPTKLNSEKVRRLLVKTFFSWLMQVCCWIGLLLYGGWPLGSTMCIVSFAHILLNGRLGGKSFCFIFVCIGCRFAYVNLASARYHVLLTHSDLFFVFVFLARIW